MSHGNQASGYEKRDVSLKQVTFWGFLTIILVIASVIGLNDYFLSVKEELVEEKILRPESIRLIKLRAVEDKMLNSYELIDTANAVYQIPIKRAIELVTEEAAGNSQNR